MFTIEQKKLIIELQTSEKHIGTLISQDDSEENLKRCCLGVYAYCCGYEKECQKIKFKYTDSIFFFDDYDQWNLYSSDGKFCCFTIEDKKEYAKIRNLAGLNDYRGFQFSHKFISKFIFTMPERVFRNFNKGGVEELNCELNKFVSEIERLAKEKKYDEIVENWKLELASASQPKLSEKK